MDELIFLLENKWIIREKDKEKYYQVKDSIKNYIDFIRDKLGYYLVETSDFIKLEKIPGKTEEWMGIEGFNNKKDYILLCLILMFLEEKQKGDQFVLSQITEFIGANWVDKEFPIDWTNYDIRKRFIKVLKYCCDIYLIIVNDGEQGSFLEDASADVLYENTGISKYMVNRLLCNIYEMNSYKDFEDFEYNRFEDRGTIRRNKVYRTLVMSPSLVKANDGENDLIYVKNYRNNLESDLEKYLSCKLHIHKNCAMAVMSEDESYEQTFPRNTNISDIAMLWCGEFRDRYFDSIELKNNGYTVISSDEFKNILSVCFDKYKDGWSKMYRESTVDKIAEDLLAEMSSFGMIGKEEGGANNIVVFDIVGKFKAVYPKDFKAEYNSENLQLQE